MSAHLQLTDEHIMIRDAAADFLASRCDSIALRKTVDAAFAGQGDGVDAALWQAFGQELGYCGLSLPEEVGGLNLGMTALTLVMEQLGKRLAPMPFFQSSVLAAGVLQYACESAGAQSYLEALASGEQSAGIAQVNQAISQMDQSTQQNAALVEEALAAAQSLSQQAVALSQTVGQFRVA